MNFGLHREKHLILVRIFFVEWCTLQAPLYRNCILYRVEPTRNFKMTQDEPDIFGFFACKMFRRMHRFDSTVLQ